MRHQRLRALRRPRPIPVAAAALAALLLLAWPMPEAAGEPDEGAVASASAAPGPAAGTAEAVVEVAHEEAHGAPLGEALPLWSAVPFAGILLSIALLPLLAPHFWHRRFPLISAFWALAFAIPFLAVFRDEAFQSILHIFLIDYLPFIILLWALFTAAGGIFVGGALKGTPRTNVLLLAAGTLMASWIGTTGAAMVMIRPVLRANAGRRHRVHTVVFFIFLVANIGGSLTPLGDPPLFLGFLHGVPFFWVTRHLLLEMLTVAGILLLAYWMIERRLYAAEAPLPGPGATELREPPPAAGAARLRIDGLHNLLFLLGIMAAVVMSGSLDLGPLAVYGHIEVPRQNLLRDGLLVLMGLLSLATTARAVRQRNEFTWFPIKEVAILFAGIFMTIIPALAILQAGSHGAMAPLIRAVEEPWQYFWVTGALSSFLDNAPTYLTFFNTALGSLGVGESEVPAMLGYLGAHLIRPEFVESLTAISAGAVFMGANTYIGNAPNFMVKSIAEEAGVPMPSFFGYLLRYSLPILVPCFLLVTLIFFR